MVRCTAQPRLVIMRLPVVAELPLILGLTGSQRLADLDLVKARPGAPWRIDPKSRAPWLEVALDSRAGAASGQW